MVAGLRSFAKATELPPAPTVRAPAPDPTLEGGTNSNVGPLLGKRTGTAKQPYCFEVQNGELFAFAGLWERWKDPSGTWVKSSAILTTTPNALTSAVHDRMPVILDPNAYDLWLDPSMTNVDAVCDLLKPYDASLMNAYPVSANALLR